MTERREQDSLERILHDVENTENAREYPKLYVHEVWQLIEIYHEYKQGHTHVLPGRSPEEKERVGEVALKGMNTIGYEIEPVKREDYIGKLYASPEAASVFGESVIINDLIQLEVVPDNTISDPLNLKMSYRDTIKLFGTNANEERIKAKPDIKRGPRIPKELTVEEAKKLMTYKDREPQTKSQ
jgi:hypothetical protein